MTDTLQIRMHVVLQVSEGQPEHRPAEDRARIEHACGLILDDELRRIEVATIMDSIDWVNF